MKTLLLALPFFISLFFTHFSFAQVADTTLARQYLERADSLLSLKQTNLALDLAEQASQSFFKYEMWDAWINAEMSIEYALRISGRYEDAANHLIQVLDIVKQNTAINQVYICLLKTSITINYFYLEFYDEGIELLKKLLADLEHSIWEEVDQNKCYQKTYSVISALFKEKKEYDKALDFGLKSLSLMRTTAGEESIETARAYLNVAVKYFYLEDYDAAIDYQLKGINIRQKIFNDEYHPELIKSYENLGIYYASNNDFDKAEEYFLRYIKIREKIYSKYHHEVAKGLSNLGAFCVRQKKYKEAKSYFEQALEIQDSLRQNDKALAYDIERLANVHLKLGDIQTALLYYQQALSLASRALDEKTIYQNPNLENIVMTKSTLEFLEGKLETILYYHDIYPEDFRMAHSGIEIGDLSLQLWEKIRLELANQNTSKQKMIKYVRSAVKSASLLAYSLAKHTKELQYAQKAFELAEQGKALLLQEAYFQTNIQRFTNLPTEMLQQEQHLSTQLANYESQLLTAIEQKDETLEMNLRNDSIFYTRRAYEQLLDDMKTNYPNYFDLKYNSPNISAEDIQENLDDNELFVEFLVHAEQQEILIFVIDKQQGLHIYQQKITNSTIKDATTLNNLLRSYLLSRADKKQKFTQLSHQFYQLLVEPLEKHLEGKRKMIIIGENFTHYIPFEVLLSSNETKDFSKMDFLIKELEISYHYAASLYLREQKEAKNYDKDLLAFAPVFDKNNRQATLQRSTTKLDTTLRSIDKNGDFRPLLNSKAEVENIMKLFQSKQRNPQVNILLKEEANEKNLKEALEQSYRFVHLASHSFSDLKTPELSGIACIPTENTERENGILFSGEVYNMSINSDLLVLSSCESGVGQLLDGEGMLGLNRSFVYAGVPNVVFSLWKVFDHVTKDMMTQFYKYILDGHSYSAALRLVKLDMLRNEATASPEFWGAFLLIGK